MVTFDEAKEMLRLDDASPSKEKVLKAFTRLSRRYPSRAFPDIHRKLLEAKSKLLSKQEWVGELLRGNTLDLAWMKPYLPETKETACPITAAMQKMARPCLVEALEDFSLEDDDPFEEPDFPFEDGHDFMEAFQSMSQKERDKLLKKMMGDFF